jgi:two-component system response regulator (stage 0 sporulation protein A)
MTINEKIDLLLRMQIHCMNPCGSGESTVKLLQEANEALAETPTIDTPDTSLEILEDILNDIGVPHHIVGYRAMVEAILLAKNNPDYLRAITKELYPAVAERVGSTPARVERSIRHGIEICFMRADYNTITRYFGQTVNPETGRPTVSEFVSMMADAVKRVERK